MKKQGVSILLPIFMTFFVLCLLLAAIFVGPVVSLGNTAEAGTITLTDSSGTAYTMTDTAGDNLPTIYSDNAYGTVTYDADTAAVVLKDVNAKKLVFAMNGPFTVELVGENTLTGLTQYMLCVTSGDVTFKGHGSLSVTGATVNYAVTFTGSVTVAGGAITVDSTAGNTVYATQNITVSGGSLTVAGWGDVLRSTGGSISITGGLVDITAKTKYRAFLADNGGISISGGVVNAVAQTQYAMRATGNLTISGGTVTASVADTNAEVLSVYKSGGSPSITISEADPNVPTNVHLVSGKAALYAQGGYSITGGRITGTAPYFSGVGGRNVTIGDDAVIDFNATTKPDVGSPIVTAGDIWETGSFDATGATVLKTKNQRASVNVDLPVTVTMNGVAQAGVTVGLYKDGTQVSTAQTDANGAVTFTVEGLLAGYTYNNYALKQEGVADGDGKFYDLEMKNPTIFVNSAGVASVGDCAFKNFEASSYITVVTENGTKTLADVAGDNAASFVTAGDGTISYDADTNTVTLNDATAEKLSFNLQSDFTVKVTGENFVGSSVEASMQASIFYVANGKTCTVTGTGVLTVMASSNAIYTTGDYVQTGATVYANAMTGVTSLYANGNATFAGGTFDGYSVTYYGIRSINGGITVSGGNVTTVATSNAIFSQGGDLTVNSGTLIVRGKTTSDRGGNSFIRSKNSVRFLGGTVLASGDKHVVNITNQLEIAPNAKVVLEITYASTAVGSRYAYGSLQDAGVVYVEGMTLTGKGLRVETMVGAEAEAVVNALPEKINEVIDGLTVTNSMTEADLKAAFAHIPVSLTYTLSNYQAADTTKAGSYDLAVTCWDTVNVSRTLTIPQIPTATVEYDYDTDEIGNAAGDINIILSETYVAAQHPMVLYVGDDEGALSGYKPLSLTERKSADGAVVTYTMGEKATFPVAATHLYVYIDGVLVATYEIPESRRMKLGEFKYSFAAMSDTHLRDSASHNHNKNFDKALTFYAEKGVSFGFVAGDVVQNARDYLWAEYNAVVNKHTDLPVFIVPGNHDVLRWKGWNYKNVPNIDNVELMVNSVATYGKAPEGLDPDIKVTAGDTIADYTVEYGGDLFVYLGVGMVDHVVTDGAPEGSLTDAHLSAEQLEWLKKTFAKADDYENVFLIFHFPVFESGYSTHIPEDHEVEGAWSNNWSYPRTVNGTTYMTEYNSSEELYKILKDHPNVIAFNGHTHSYLELGNLTQTKNYNFNYTDYTYTTGGTDPLGFTCVRIPANGASHQSFLTSVYDNGILLTGYDTNTGEIAPYATYFIANEDAGLGSEGKDLSVNFTETTPAGKVYSLDMIWENSDLSFDYVGGTQGAWNPADHTYGETTGAGWEDDDLLVTVVNHSNQGVKVTMDVTDADEADGLTVTADKSTETIATAEGTAYENAPKVEYTLTITGTPTAPVTKVATATVSFAAAE